MARKDWYSDYNKSQFKQANDNDSAKNLTDEEAQQAMSALMQMDQNFSLSNNTIGSLKGLKAKLEALLKDDPDNPILQAQLSAVEKGLLSEQKNLEVKQDFSSLQLSDNNDTVTTASGKTYTPEILSSLMKNAFMGDLDSNFISAENNPALQKTLELGRPLTTYELKQIVGDDNLEEKETYYHWLLDKECLNIGFASNGEVPNIDPTTGKVTFDKNNGQVLTDKDKPVSPGPITITKSENLQGENSIITESSDGTIEKVTTTSKGDHIINFRDAAGNVFNEKVGKDWNGFFETAGNLLETIKTGVSNIRGSGEGEPTPTPPQQETPKENPQGTFVGDEVSSIDDKGSGIDQFYRQTLDTLNVDPNSQYSNMYKQSMYGAINAQEQISNATLAQAELDAYKMLGQQQLELENQIASQRMQAIKSGVTSSQLASQQLANIFAAQSGAAQVAQGVLNQRTSNASSFAQQRTNVTSDLYNMLQQNQTTAANVYAQMAAAQSSYMSYMNQPWQQYDAAAHWQQKLGDDFYLLQGGTPKSYLNNTK